VSPRSVDCLAHSFRNFVRLSSRDANATLTIADSDERVE
jgi:hypothetical protein